MAGIHAMMHERKETRETSCAGRNNRVIEPHRQLISAVVSMTEILKQPVFFELRRCPTTKGALSDGQSSSCDAYQSPAAPFVCVIHNAQRSSAEAVHVNQGSTSHLAQPRGRSSTSRGTERRLSPCGQRARRIGEQERGT